MDKRVSELQSILRAARAIKRREILKGENFALYHSFDFNNFEQRILEEIDEILFYIELERMLSDK